MHYEILAMLVLVPAPSFCLVDCFVACTRCQAGDRHYPELLEVYCAMCRECDDHRRELRSREHSLREQIIYNIEDYPEDCPTPPPCESDGEDVPPYTLAQTIRFTTTSSSTTTTTRRPCPAVTGCKKKRTPRPHCYYPCVPACPCPFPQLYASAAPPQSALSASAGGSTGYLHVYVGVPKDILQSANR